MKIIFRVLLACALLAAPAVFAASAWVTDQFEITLRSGPSTSNAITRMLDSGTELEVVERDADSGYSRVRTSGGTEGWVLTRYLMSEPSAREQLQKLTSQLTNASSRGNSLESQLATVQLNFRTAEQKIATLEREKAGVEKELADTRRTAANVLAINDQNQALMDQLAAAQLRADTLEQENRNLNSQKTRYWFMTGALVLLVGISLGIWLPRIRWQRRSRYDRF
ncbi:MAG: TIGR04211 family SH3 domain-containing protein [Gammaproteobacteria bacterium]|nr:TIGR04211 family SH3 domain-containing protein [Gammaproteobacteria bacterium]